MVAAVDVVIEPAPPRYVREPVRPTPEEWLIARLTEALSRFGVGTRVGLVTREACEQYRIRIDDGLRDLLLRKGGIGVLIGCAPGARAGVAQTLELMGFSWTADCDIGVQGHLCSKLRPAPAVPVDAADGGRARASAEVADVTGLKRCRGPCGQWRADDQFGWWNKALGRKSPYCRSCCSARSSAAHAARKAKPVS
jgi:hypothetical protein